VDRGQPRPKTFCAHKAIVVVLSDINLEKSGKCGRWEIRNDGGRGLGPWHGCPRSLRQVKGIIAESNRKI